MAFGLGHGAPAIFGDTLDEGAVNIERDHGNTMETGEPKQRQIKIRPVSPSFGPSDPFEKFLCRQFALHPAIQHRLRRAGEGLEAQDYLGPPTGQGGDGRQLPAVMVGIVVVFAKKDDRTRRDVGDETVMRNGLAGQWQDPLPRLRARVLVRVFSESLGRQHGQKGE